MKSDAQLQAEVSRELAWDPAIDATHVGVAVHDGVVTLGGHVHTWAEKCAAEPAVQRVEGVRAVALELAVHLLPGQRRSDAEITAAATAALAWHALVPHERLQLRVERGWLTLTGELDSHWQRRAAEQAVQSLAGVVGVSNGIRLRPCPAPPDTAGRIREALARQARRGAGPIEVSVSGTTATLRGQVACWAERAAAQAAAWAAPGITMVVDDIRIGAAPPP